MIFQSFPHARSKATCLCSVFVWNISKFIIETIVVAAEDRFSQGVHMKPAEMAAVNTLESIVAADDLGICRNGSLSISARLDRAPAS